MAKRSKSLIERAGHAVGRVAGSAAGAVEGVAAVHHSASEPPRHEEIHFERRDINFKRTLSIGIGVLVGMWIITGLLYFYFQALSHYRARVSPPPLPAQLAGRQQPPEPRLQASPELDLKQFRAREDWELTHYHWLDKSHGTVAIPIADAIKLTLERGIPATNTPPNPTNTPPEQGTRETGFQGKVEPEPR